MYRHGQDGRPGQCNESMAHALMDRFVECGGNFIDTADVYSDGLAEQYIGTWLSKRQNRDEMVIATKFGSLPPVEPLNGLGGSRKHVTRNIERSLKRLQTHYVDLYQLHAWDYATPIEETLRTLNDLVRCGKVNYIGVSNVTGWQLQKIVMLCDFMGLSRCVSLQQEYSLLCRTTEWEMAEVCRNEGIGLTPWGPLKAGWLTGKIRRGATSAPEGSRIGHSQSNPHFYQKSQFLAHPNFSEFATDKVWHLLDVMDGIAKSHGKSVAQVGLRWLLQKDVVPSVIIGTKTIEQFNENIGAASGWELTAQQMAELDEASSVDMPQPYSFILGDLKDRRFRSSDCK
ncbi:1-deoxyxylulose-5-phosphate synthase YajO-like isoform X2 [Ptychodera flava]|uniref:1-deoxyxylulose-5-phosphate synthase YajO-like isoform X2 n=1 Tax=Ptychodera flava TaxID=63121 RepID=UPI00396A70CA